MRTFLWPAEDGWPYPDSEAEEVDLASDVDEDLLCLTTPSSHVLDQLSDIERNVVEARFGLGGAPVRSMKQLQASLGLPRSELRDALGSGLSKIRAQLTA